MVREKTKILLSEDFSSFEIGAFPYDPDHSAMGEYHFYPEKGFKGIWFDPIADWNYKGPTWMITSPALDGKHVMEQMRIVDPEKAMAIPTLRTGSIEWTDYTVSTVFRPMIGTGISGILFRYVTSLAHYGLFISDKGIELVKVSKRDRKCLATAPAPIELNSIHTLSAEVYGDNIRCFLDGNLVFSVNDSTYKKGCIALSAAVPTQYISVKIETDEITAATIKEEEIKKQKTGWLLESSIPQPELYNILDLKNYGAGRQIRFGHLTGTNELFFIIAQNQKRVFKDRYPFISCLTAVSIETGNILWQIGEPCDNEEVIELTTDLPFQIYDINNDGVDEVIAVWDFKLRILDGRNGKILQEVPTPVLTDPPETVTGLEYGRYAFTRLNVDAIRIVNVTGKKRPSDILIKDRYSRIWIYNSSLHLLWTFSKYNTGHFPYSLDIDEDGKDEIFSCYNMIDHDGKLLWSLPIESDHTDEIIIGKFNPDKEPLIAMVSGWEGFMLVDLKGNVIIKDINGHGQRISVGNYIPERKGLEICTTTYWGNNGIIYMHDCDGNEIWAHEMLCNGNIISPVNWDGSGQDLILMNGNFGMIDGYGHHVVKFPDDGHPNLAAEVIDVTGDNRDEIILWDRKKMFIYTPSGNTKTRDGKIYNPIKYPMYNASNYRGEYSFPRWTDIQQPL